MKRPAPRKKPRQERSRSTVDYILKAAAQLLEDGGARLSTNRIAEKAGVAVASLYQYFPNKEAIVAALHEAELSAEQAEFDRRRSEWQDGSAADAIRLGVRSTIAIHARTPKLVKSILEAIPFLGGGEALVKARRKVIEMVAETMRRRAGELRPARSVEIRAFLVVQAVEGAIHAAAHERPEYLRDPAFADELVELVERFLLAE